MTDTDKIIKSLEKLIAELRVPEIGTPSRYELRYWDNTCMRSDDADFTFSKFNTATEWAISRFKLWCNVEIYDAINDKVVLRYEESKD